jgi:hypothetical protein
MKSVYGRKTTTRRGSPCCGAPCAGALTLPRPQTDWARSSGATAHSALPPRAPAPSTRRAAPSSVSQCGPRDAPLTSTLIRRSLQLLLLHGLTRSGRAGATGDCMRPLGVERLRRLHEPDPPVGGPAIEQRGQYCK